MGGDTPLDGISTSGNISYSMPLVNASDPPPLDDAQEKVWNPAFSAFIATILIFASLFAIIGNCMVLTVIARHRGMRTRTNLFLVNLAIADLLVGATLMPFSITTMVTNKWLFGEDYICQFNGWMNSFCLTASIHTLMYIGVHKYFSIVHPLAKNLQLRTIVALMCLAWFWAAVISTLNMAGLEVEYKPGTSQCGPKYPDDIKAYVIHVILQLTVMIIPFFTLVYCYTRMFLEIKQHSARLRQNSTVEEEYILQTQKKVAVTLFIVLATFFMMALPYVLYATYTTVKKKKNFPAFINPLAYTFLYLNSMVNPIIYAFRSPAFREGYKEILCQTPNYVISDESDEQPIRTNRLASLVSQLRRASRASMNSVHRLSTAAVFGSNFDLTAQHSSNKDSNAGPKLTKCAPSSPDHAVPAGATSPLSPCAALAEKRARLKRTRRKTLFELLKATRQSNAQSVVHRNGDMIIMKGGKIVSVVRQEEAQQNRALLDRLKERANNAGLANNTGETDANNAPATTAADEGDEVAAKVVGVSETNGLYRNNEEKESMLGFSKNNNNHQEESALNSSKIDQALSDVQEHDEPSELTSHPAEKLDYIGLPTKSKPPPLLSISNPSTKSPRPKSPSGSPIASPAAIFINLDDDDHVTGVVTLSPTTREDLKRAATPLQPPQPLHQSRTEPGLANLSAAHNYGNTVPSASDLRPGGAGLAPRVSPAGSSEAAVSRSSEDIAGSSARASAISCQPRMIRLGSLEYLDPPSTLFSSSSFSNLRSRASMEALTDSSAMSSPGLKARLQKLHVPSMKRFKRPVVVKRDTHL